MSEIICIYCTCSSAVYIVFRAVDITDKLCTKQRNSLYFLGLKPAKYSQDRFQIKNCMVGKIGNRQLLDTRIGNRSITNKIDIRKLQNRHF